MRWTMRPWHLPLVQAVRAVPVAVHLPRPPSLELIYKRRLVADDFSLTLIGSFKSGSFNAAAFSPPVGPRLQPAAKPEHRRLIELTAATDRCHPEASMRHREAMAFSNSTSGFPPIESSRTIAAAV